MQIITRTIKFEEVKPLSQAVFGNMLKAVIDVERGLIAVDAELHADLEALLLENGSRQKDLWGINLYMDLPVDQWIEFDSMINLRPSQGNMSRGVEDRLVRDKIIQIVNSRVIR